MADLRWISTVAYARTRVNFSRVNKTEAMYGKSHMKVKVEPRWNFAWRVAYIHTLGPYWTVVKTFQPFRSDNIKKS